MGIFSGTGRTQGRSSAEGGNGNVKDTRAEHGHSAVGTPNLDAVRDLQHGSRDYIGRHRGE